MPERTYSGFAPRGEVDLPSGRHVAFERGVPVEVTDEEAAHLDSDPDWGGTPDVDDDLAGLDKEQLLAVAAAEGVEVSDRWGAKRLADTIREARLAATAEVDDPADTEEA